MPTALDESRLAALRTVTQRLAAEKDGLRSEFGRLFDRTLVDPPMAVGRARRLLEILVTDEYIAFRKLEPPFRQQIKPLFDLIEELAAAQRISPLMASLCHAVRIEGNRVLHYRPDDRDEGRGVEVTAATLAQTLEKLTEVAEGFLTGEHSVYAAALREPFARMYHKLRSNVCVALAGDCDGPFPLAEALAMLFRSTVRQMTPADMQALYELRGGADMGLRADDKDEALRRLRNLGLIEHDGPTLFVPTRSKRVWPSPSGEFLLMLASQGQADPGNLAREVVRKLNTLAGDQPTLDLLARLQKNGRIDKAEIETVRHHLRNLQLVSHSTKFLAGAEEVQLTDLGYYVLGKHLAD